MRWNLLQEFEKGELEFRRSGLGDSKKTCHEYLEHVKTLRPRLGAPLEHRLALLVVGSIESFYLIMLCVYDTVCRLNAWSTDSRCSC
jgi:hypothetical protein